MHGQTYRNEGKGPCCCVVVLHCVVVAPSHVVMVVVVSLQCIRTTTHSPNQVSDTLGKRATHMIEERHIRVFSPQGVSMIAKRNTHKWGNYTTPQQLHGSLPQVVLLTAQSGAMGCQGEPLFWVS